MNQYARTMVFTNVSQVTCTMSGYPILQLLDSAGRAVPAPVTDGSGYLLADPGATLVSLPPGGTASFAFGGPGYNAPANAPCTAVKSVSVTPPGAQTPLTLATDAAACPQGIQESAVGAGVDSAAPSSTTPSTRSTSAAQLATSLAASHGGQWWGVDSASPLSSSFLSAIRSYFGATPTMWGRYVSDCSSFCVTSSEVGFARQNHIYLFLIVGDLNDPPLGVCGNDSNASQGASDARAAVASAHSLGVPSGTLLIKDFEGGCFDPTAAYISAWYSTVKQGGSGYQVGFYGNSFSSSNSFPRGYCGVGNPSGFSWNTTLYATEPEPGPFGGPGSAPAFVTSNPPCTSTTDLWQYSEAAPRGAPSVDVDEAQPHTSGLWAPSGNATVAWTPGAAVNPANDHQYVFWHGTDGDVREAYFSNGAWHGPLEMATFGWGGQPASSAASAAVGADESQYVFWRGPDGDIWEAFHYTSWNSVDMTSAHGWGQATSAPAVAVNPINDDQYVFWRGTDGSIRETYFSNGAWHGPLDMSGFGWGGQPAGSAPGDAIGADESQYAFWAVPSSDIWEAFHYNSWTSVDMTGAHGWGQATSAPAVAVNPINDDQYVFWRGTDGSIREGYFSNGAWHGPLNMSGFGWGGQPSSSAPAVAVANDESQYVFWHGPEGDFWEAYHYGSWASQDMTNLSGWR
jgi:hypothetical protein